MICRRFCELRRLESDITHVRARARARAYAFRTDAAPPPASVLRAQLLYGGGVLRSHGQLAGCKGLSSLCSCVSATPNECPQVQHGAGACRGCNCVLVPVLSILHRVSIFTPVLSSRRVVAFLVACMPGSSEQFVEPIVSHISGSHCTDAINQLVETGDPFSTLEDACREALYKAILSTLMLCIVSYKKVPPTHSRTIHA